MEAGKYRRVEVNGRSGDLKEQPTDVGTNAEAAAEIVAHVEHAAGWTKAEGKSSMSAYNRASRESG